ncbi:MAG: ferric reductase-like transmembrane domain-containing protein [Proteiniphilum sp.]|jgi:DMSO/TMAO reductase YedYZ heme-binding membrane subunit|uniref:hypothetical protein n=1 Tax=Proteiniphilum sp. TaxID=1926877 RepID=UPI0009265DCE|nr:hypothetical protein [Proteiniphilum sp.]MEA5130214.1 ferric reductase-like transmembrane domain-containing protein [Proteiniphilum sp.]OJV74690.1 MAG: hypothetical protein BGO34_00145 [Bacteroidia bacterium 44-10]
MIKFFIDLIQFLNSTAPLLTSLAIFTLLAILLSKSIKKHATIYYIVLAIPFALVAIPFIGRLFGVEMFNFNRIPFLGGILRDYIHFGTFAFPILIIVMYTGALNPKIPWVKKLLNIRKELSIISGFPVLTHALIRVTNTFPRSLMYFTNNEEYMANARVTSELGAGISNFSFVLGIVLLALFLPLWITSFKSVHKRMGKVKWKKWQKWSYPFYALLFIHAMGIQVGGLLSTREALRQAQAVEVTAKGETAGGSDNKTARIALSENDGRSGEKVSTQERGGHARSIGFADINVSRETKRYIHITSLILIFGSYLYIRLRKAKKDATKRRSKIKII